MVKAREACELLRELPEMKLGHVLQEIGGILPGHRFASVRAGVEMAMIDAAAKSVGVPFGERGVVSGEEAVMSVEKRCFWRNRSVIDLLLFKGMEELTDIVDHAKQRHHIIGDCFL
ncbi:hypothetical protein Bca4012_041554 [Brassica carinata]